VAGVPLVPCMECEDCRQGNYSLCKHYTFIGSRIQGAFAEYVAMPQENVVKFDPSVPYETAAFFEPSTVALHGIYCADYHEGGNVAVLGGGTIGMFTFQWAKLLGAAAGEQSHRLAVFPRDNVLHREGHGFGHAREQSDVPRGAFRHAERPFVSGNHARHTGQVYIQIMGGVTAHRARFQSLFLAHRGDKPAHRCHRGLVGGGKQHAAFG
jgi:hypothetical protein